MDLSAVIDALSTLEAVEAKANALHKKHVSGTSLSPDEISFLRGLVELEDKKRRNLGGCYAREILMSLPE